MLLWELFGFRGWHVDDLAGVDCDDLDMMIATAKKRHEQNLRQQQEAARAR